MSLKPIAHLIFKLAPLQPALKTLVSRGFLTLQLRQRHCRHGWSYHHPNRFHKELQVLGSESWSHCSINILDILSTWSSADLHNVAWFATVEAETMMGSLFIGWVQSRSMGWGTEDVVGVGA